jgi:hypothetical protein
MGMGEEGEEADIYGREQLTREFNSCSEFSAMSDGSQSLNPTQLVPKMNHCRGVSTPPAITSQVN